MRKTPIYDVKKLLYHKVPDLLYLSLFGTGSGVWEKGKGINIPAVIGLHTELGIGDSRNSGMGKRKKGILGGLYVEGDASFDLSTFEFSLGDITFCINNFFMFTLTA